MPTISVEDNTGGDYHGTEDAHMKSSNTTYNYGSTDPVEITKWNVSNHTHLLLSFSGLSNISPTVTVSSATLGLYGSAGSAGSRTATFRRVLRDWEEGTRAGADRTSDTPDSCCWDEYGGGSSWTTAGCLSDGNDRSATVTGTMSMDNVAEYKTVSTAQLASDAQDMINSPSANYGLHGERTDGGVGNVYNSFISSTGTDGSRPYLSVTYTTGGAAGNPWYYYAQQ